MQDLFRAQRPEKLLHGHHIPLIILFWANTDRMYKGMQGKLDKLDVYFFTDLTSTVACEHDP